MPHLPVIQASLGQNTLNFSYILWRHTILGGGVGGEASVICAKRHSVVFIPCIFSSSLNTIMNTQHVTAQAPDGG